MVFPSTTLFLPLPEEIGIIENVNAIVELCDNVITIPCEHIARYHASSGCVWPELFDESLKPFSVSREICNDDNPNTSAFQGIYTFYDENYLEGKFYFIFDFCKNGVWHRKYRTKTQYFKEDVSNYYGFVELLNKK